MILAAVVFTVGMALAQEPTKGCCKSSESCSKEKKEMCEKYGCKDGKCTKECKKACKEAGMKDCKKSSCCKEAKSA